MDKKSLNYKINMEEIGTRIQDLHQFQIKLQQEQASKGVNTRLKDCYQVTSKFQIKLYQELRSKGANQE